MNGSFSLSLLQNTLPSHYPSYINPYMNQCFSLYRPIMDDFCLGDIDLRYDVIRKFAEHTDKVLKMLLQSGSTDNFGHICSMDRRFFIATKTPMYDWLPIMAGGWVDWNGSYYGTDIISLYAYQRNISYHNALDELLDAFSKKENFGDRKSETKWHIQ